jgi:hypothetical protein
MQRHGGDLSGVFVAVSDWKTTGDHIWKAKDFASTSDFIASQKSGKTLTSITNCLDFVNIVMTT